MKIEIGDNLKTVLNNCLEVFDSKQMNSFFLTLKEFMQSGEIHGLEIEYTESEGGSCWDLHLRKIMEETRDKIPMGQAYIKD